MKYTDAKAQACAKAWGLSRKTIRVWKHRDHIPDEYAATPIPMKEVIRVLDEDWWNVFRESIADQSDELDRYLDRLVPESISRVELMQRLRDFRRWVKKL